MNTNEEKLDYQRMIDIFTTVEAKHHPCISLLNDGDVLSVDGIRLSTNELKALDDIASMLHDYLDGYKVSQKTLIKIAVGLFLMDFFDRKITLSKLAGVIEKG